MAEGSEVSVDRGPAVLERLHLSKLLRRTTRRVGIPGIIVARKVAAEADIAALRHLAVVHSMAEVDPTAEVNTASWQPVGGNLPAAYLITIFPRPGSATFSTGPIFMFARRYILRDCKRTKILKCCNQKGITWAKQYQVLINFSDSCLLSPA